MHKLVKNKTYEPFKRNFQVRVHNVFGHLIVRKVTWQYKTLLLHSKNSINQDLQWVWTYTWVSMHTRACKWVREDIKCTSIRNLEYWYNLHQPCWFLHSREDEPLKITKNFASSLSVWQMAYDILSVKKNKRQSYALWKKVQ